MRSRRSASETLCREDLCTSAKKPSFEHRHHQLAFSALHTSKQAITPPVITIYSFIIAPNLNIDNQNLVLYIHPDSSFFLNMLLLAGIVTGLESGK